jgi:hypothetical protein
MNFCSRCDAMLTARHTRLEASGALRVRARLCGDCSDSLAQWLGSQGAPARLVTPPRRQSPRRAVKRLPVPTMA